MKKYLLIAALTLGFAAGTMTAQAALVGSSNGLVDTDTGLEWLDVTLNVGLSYNSMINSGLNGYAAQGYRYASVYEVGTLFENAGAVLPAFGGADFSAQSRSAGLLLISFLGATYTSSNNTFLQAASGTLATPSSVYTPWIRGSVSGATGISYGGHKPYITAADPNTGHWLVKKASMSPVPLPASLPLLMGGLGVFGLLRRRKSRG